MSTLNNPDGIEIKPNLSTGTAWDNFDKNLETPAGAETIHHTYGTCYQTIKEADEIKTEESSEIHLNLNQPPNQLQHQSTAPKSKKRKLSRFNKVTSSSDNELNPTVKKGNFPSNLIFLKTKSAYQYRIQHIQTFKHRYSLDDD